jgi:hypothetical protein
VLHFGEKYHLLCLERIESKKIVCITLGI